jgi:heterotetrameric sarcosine oxidase gamma subunit
MKRARVLCLAENEFLIVSREERNSTLPDRIAGDLAEYGLALTDVSDDLAALELRGSSARDVLAIGCGIDAKSRDFAVGCCTRARLADVDVVIDYVADAPRFDLYFSRTRLQAIHFWLSNAALELESSLVHTR